MIAQIPVGAVVESQVHIVGCLEGEVQVYDKGVGDLFQDVELGNGVLDLLICNQLLLLETL